MSVELLPLGVQCNIACQYCYQHLQRDVEDKQKPYNMQRMKEAILKEGGPFVLFGGEALLIPPEDLEELWSWGLEKFGSNALQTNATLITDAHIALFKKYKVSVGVSIDGPGELNDIRWAGSLEKTRKLTEKSQQNIEKLCAEGIAPGLIITLHRGNALPGKLPLMGEWLKYMDGVGVRSARLHLMEIENEKIRQFYHLTPRQNLEALLYFHELGKGLKHLYFDVFKEIGELMKADDKKVSCVWNACDPYTTASVQGVDGNGQRTNCGRANKEGIDFVKAAMPSYMRYVALYNTPEEHGGCKGCRFFVMCKGQCPGTAMEGDWRNKTEHCEVWKTLFTMQEEKMIAQGEIPLSRHPILPLVEQEFIRSWSRGQNTSLQNILQSVKKLQSAAVETAHEK